MKRTLTSLACLICLLPLLRAGEAEDLATAPAIRSTPEASRDSNAAFAGRLVTRENKLVPRSFKWSLAPLVASQSLDVASSYGMRELNPALAGADGRFGGKAVALKIGITGALVGVEYLVVKIHPGAAKFFTSINWSGAALTTGFAAHNFSIR